MKNNKIQGPLFFTILFVAYSEISFSQESGRMETDRPDQTESPAITKKNWIQGEIGFNREYYKERNTWVTPTALFKYGLSKKFEFRLITEFESFHAIPNTGAKAINGMRPIQLGGKIALSEEKGIIPLTSLIFHTGLPFISSNNFKTANLSPNFRFTMQHTLSENVALGYNLGAEWDGESSTPTWIYTLAPGKNFGKRWYGYVELFGEITKGQSPEHGFDAGIAYYLNDDFKIDVSAGKGLNKHAFKQYVAVGFSFRLPI